MYKKFSLVMAVVMVAAMLLAACKPAAKTAADCGKTGVFCVGLVTDVGKVDNKSFNQTAWEGVQLAMTNKDADWVQYIETVDSKDYAKNPIAVIAPFRRMSSSS